MSKEEIIEYLKNYALVQEMATIFYQDINYFDIYNYKVAKDSTDIKNNKLYFTNMCKVYNAYCTMKNFSNIENILLNSNKLVIKEQLESFSKNLKIEINEDNINDARKAEVIRDAFNHNNNPSHYLFSLSKDATTCEVDVWDSRKGEKRKIEDGRTHKFKAQFSLEDINDITKKLQEVKKNIMYARLEMGDLFDQNLNDITAQLKKVEFFNYHIKDTMSKDDLDRIEELKNLNNITDGDCHARSLIIREILAKYNLEIKSYNLTEEQRLTMAAKLAKIPPKELIHHRDFYVYHYALDAIPIASFKSQSLNLQGMISQLCPFGSYNDMVDCFNSKNYSNQTEYMFDHLKIRDEDFLTIHPLVAYLDTMISQIPETYQKETTITLEDKDIKLSDIRNSLIHSKWYQTENGELSLFDGLTNNKYIYDLKRLGNIKRNTLLDLAEEYYHHHSEEKGKELIKTLK
jgi:hypothetical protein